MAKFRKSFEIHADESTQDALARVAEFIDSGLVSDPVIEVSGEIPGLERVRSRAKDVVKTRRLRSAKAPVPVEDELPT